MYYLSFLLLTIGQVDCEELVRASVQIQIFGPKKKCSNCNKDHYDWMSYGSGTVVASFPDNDKYYSYVLTASHLFNKGEDCAVIIFNDNEDVIGSWKGQVRLKTKSGNSDPDLALVGFGSDQQLPSIAIASEGYQMAVGDQVFQIGCPGGEVPPKPLAKRLQIIAINQGNGAGNIECTRMPAQGRSGGGLFNSSKELIGVCCRANHESKKGIYSSLSEIHKFLKNTEFKWLLKPAQKNASVLNRRLYHFFVFGHQSG